MKRGVIERGRLTDHMREMAEEKEQGASDSGLLGYYMSHCVASAQCHGPAVSDEMLMHMSPDRHLHPGRPQASTLSTSLSVIFISPSTHP